MSNTRRTYDGQNGTAGDRPLFPWLGKREATPASFPAILGYHDIVRPEEEPLSGLPGTYYKLSIETFRRHLGIVALSDGPQTSCGVSASLWQKRIIFTFDDGGSSAWAHAAPQLEEHGYKGCFFIPTDFIGQEGFLTAEQIRDLHARGHLVGTHSRSHPRRMSACSWEGLMAEWTHSCQVLAEIVGEPVLVGSVPGGCFSNKVARSAAAAGLKLLFTSRPTRNIHSIDGCLVVGRFAINRGTSDRTVLGLAAGRPFHIFSQTLLWRLKGMLRSLGGPFYPLLRKRILAATGVKTG